MAGPSPSLGHGTATKNGSVDDQKDVSTAYLESLINDWLIKAQVAFDTQNLDELLQIIDDQGYWRDVELFLKKKNDHHTLWYVLQSEPSLLLITNQHKTYQL